MFSYIYFVSISERNLNPKAACLKRREEEKTEDLPGGRGLSQEEITAQQVALAGKVRNLLLPLLPHLDDGTLEDDEFCD